MTEQLIERASLLFDQKRYDDAQKNIMEVLAIEPDNIHGLILLAEINIQNDDYQKALDIINEAIGIEPDYDVLFYTKSKILLGLEKLKEARIAIDEAVMIDPYDSNNHAMKGQILLQERKFESALESANEALNIDSTNVFALNVRSTALLKLNRNEDSFKTIEGALHEDPNNEYTHATYGWNLLEKGDNEKALEHFRESLKNNPNSEYAQSGMAEALKAKYFIYRWFLNYSFWMQNMTAKNQWVFIIGFYIGQKVLRGIANKNPNLEPYIMPIIILMAVFAFSTWVINPLINLIFRFNTYGQHLLTKEEKGSSNLVGLSLLVFVFGLISLLFLDKDISFTLMIIGFTFMLPLSKFYEKPTYFFKSYNILLLVFAILSVYSSFITLDVFNGFTIMYIFGFIGFQWIANFFLTK